jgi:hypothetical protein
MDESDFILNRAIISLRLNAIQQLISCVKIWNTCISAVELEKVIRKSLGN